MMICLYRRPTKRKLLWPKGHTASFGTSRSVSENTPVCKKIYEGAFFSQSKMKRKRIKSKSDDEGFESPTSPIYESNGLKMAPLANQEDLDEAEKHEVEGTKEQKSPVLSVNI